MIPRTGLFFLASALAVWSAFSCRKPEVPQEKEEQKVEAAYLKLETPSVSFTSDGGKKEIEVLSNRTVVLGQTEDWYTARILPESNGFTSDKKTLEIVVSPYRKGRSATLKLSATDCNDVELGIVQEASLSATNDLMSMSLKADANGMDKDLDFSLSGTSFTGKYLKWIERQNPEMMVPVFETNGEKVLCNGQEVVSGKTALDFSKDFQLTVVAENGAEKTYSVSLNCPQINAELAVLHLKPSSIIANKTTYVPTDIVLYDKSEGASGQGWWDSSDKGAVEVRGRGNSTWGLPKKPFRIKFSEKFSPVGLNHAKAKSWVLLAQDMDKSLLRNHLAFEYSRVLFNPSEGWHDSKAVLFTPSSKHVNVYFTGPYYDSSKGRNVEMKGDYLGVYQMSDQMEMAKGRVELEKLTASDGNKADKITGGYMIEADLHEGNQYSAVKGVKMTYKYPEDDDYAQAQYDYISDFIRKAETALYSSNYKDPSTGWRKWFDEKTLADYIIVKEFVGDMDGYTSTYMYKRRGVDKLFFGPIWDCDKGWDNDKRVPHYEYRPLESLMIKAGFWMPPYVSDDWFWRFWSDETFRAFVNKRWKAKKAELEAVTERTLTGVPEKMAKAIEANFSVWRFNYQYSDEAKMPAATYPEEIQRIRKLSANRAALLDRLFAE